MKFMKTLAGPSQRRLCLLRLQSQVLVQAAAREESTCNIVLPWYNMLVVLRWVAGVAARVRAAARRRGITHGRNDQQRDLALIAERLAASMLYGDYVGCPLAQAASEGTVPGPAMDEAGVGYIYQYFLRGGLVTA